MQAEEPVEIEHRLSRDIDVRAQGVILRFAVRNYYVEAICCSTLKNYDQAFIACTRFNLPESGASEKARHRRRAHNNESTVFQEHTTCYCHKVLAGL